MICQNCKKEIPFRRFIFRFGLFIRCHNCYSELKPKYIGLYILTSFAIIVICDFISSNVSDILETENNFLVFHIVFYPAFVVFLLIFMWFVWKFWKLKSK